MNLSFIKNHGVFCRKESEVVLSAVVEDVLAKTNLSAQDIDILIINCSIFSPTPSLCAMVSNKFKATPRIWLCCENLTHAPAWPSDAT